MVDSLHIEPVDTDGSLPRSNLLLRLGQVALSMLVLWGLTRNVDLWRISEVLTTTSSLRWLALALGLKALSNVLHELRLWLALDTPRPSLSSVLEVGFLAGLLNMVLPARGGDLVAVGLLNRRCKVRPVEATSVVGLVNFLEVAVFGLVAMVIFVAGSEHWQLILGASAQVQAMQLVTAITLATGAACVALVLVARRIGGGEVAATGASPLAHLRDLISTSGDNLASRRWLATQVATALMSSLLVLSAYAAGLSAAGLDLELPFLAAACVMVLSGLAAVALPPSMGAGPAAASVAVLAVFGVDQTGALVYAATWWVIAILPTLAFGLPALWTTNLSAAEPGA